MPRSIADIRKANGGLDNLTDEDILQATYEDYAPYYKSLDEYASAVGYSGAGRGMGSSRVSAGIDNYQAGLYGLGGAAARAVGARDVGGWMDQRRAANEQAADYATQRSRDLGAVDSWGDVHGVGDFANYAGGLAAQSLPYAAEAFVGGVAARGLATGARAALAAARTPEELAAATRTMRGIETAGGTVASYPSSVGDILGNQREAGGENLGSALVGGVPYAALNAFGVEGMAARGLRPLAMGEGRLARMATGAATTAFGEGLGETGQEMINQGFGRMAVNPSETLFSDDAVGRYKESFIGGATLGGLMGGAGGFRRERTVDQGNFDLTTRGDTPQGPIPQLGYSPLAGTPIVFPDGSVTLGTEQELLKRYGANQTTTALGLNQPYINGDLVNSPGGNVVKTQQSDNAAAPAVPGIASFDETDQGLTDVGIPLANGKKTREKQRAFYEAAATSGIPLDSDLLVPYWGLVTQNKFGDKTKVALQNAIVAHKKEQANGTPSAPVAATAPSSAGTSPVADGSVGAGGPAPTVDAGGSGTAVDTRAAGNEVPPVVDTGVQPATVVNTQQQGKADPFQVVPDAAPAEPVVKRKKKVVVTPATQAQAYVAPSEPAAAAPKAPSVDEEGDGYVDDEDAWNDFKPDDGPAYGALTPGHKQTWAELRKMGKLSGKYAQEMASEYDESSNLSDDIRSTIKEIFGERDAAIVEDKFVNHMTDAEIAEKHGLSRGGVSQRVGEGKVGQKFRANAIKAAQDKNGWTDDYVQSLMGDLGDLGGQSLNNEEDVDAAGGMTDTQIEDENADVSAEDMTLGEAGMHTISTAGGSSGYTDDVSDKNLKKLKPRELAIVLSQRAIEAREEADKLMARIRKAKDAGRDEIAGHQGQETLAEAVERAKSLRMLVKHHLAKAEEALSMVQRVPTKVIAKESKQSAAEEAKAIAEEGVMTPAEQYAELTSGYQEVPAYGDLGKDAKAQIDDLAHRGELNLSAINTVLSKSMVDPQADVLEAVSANGTQINDADVEVDKALRGKSFDEAVKWALNNASNEYERAVMRAVSDRLDSLAKRGTVFRFFVTGEGKQLTGGASGLTVSTPAGLGEAMRVDVVLNGAHTGDRSGTNFQTLAHELIHAATQAQLKFAPNGSLAKEFHEFYSELAKGVKERQAAGKPHGWEKRFWKGANNSLRDADELLAWGLTDKEFQKYLNDIVVTPKQTLWDRFVNLVSKALGIPVRANSALAKLMQLSEGLLGENLDPYVAEANSRFQSLGLQPNTTAWPNWALNPDLGAPVWVEGDLALYRAQSTSGATWYVPGMRNGDTSRTAQVDVNSFTGNQIAPRDLAKMKAAADSLRTQTNAMFKADVTPAKMKKPVSDLTRSLKVAGSKALNTMMFSNDLFNRAASMGISAAKELGALYQKRAALTGQIEREVIRIEQMFNSIPDASRQEANKFVREMRFAKKWGFNPDWRSDETAVDQELKAKFDALPAQAQAWAKALFKHGDKMRELKQNAVRDAFTSVYDARIADAEKAGDEKKVAALNKEKAAEMTRYKRLFSQDERNPYAPVRRFGNWVVVGKSAAYMKAEEAGDKETMAKLESNADHYYVDFRESFGEAAKLSEDLNASGLIAGEPREKEDARNDMYGGLMQAFDKLRGNIESELGNATTAEEKQALRAAREVVVDLYLRNLADTSARKSELRFKGVAGDIDMLRSFSSQGRADAHFLASATYNPQMTETIVKMRQQKKSVGNETQKTMAFNEIMARHEQSMKYQDGGWFDAANKMTAVTSAWMLATSPMYYLQNLTQPMVISVPYMTGKHSYDGAWGQLMRAYHEMGPLVTSGKNGQGFDFSKVPEDVRSAILELVNRGRIDIGMDTELGKVKLEGDTLASKAANRTSQFFRSLAQKAEAINRVSTAMAAYRLELKKTGDAKAALEYADEVLAKTHGDYTASNAPRVFNTPGGKVALQFRKFQLIQLTLLTKMVHDAFKGAKPAERAAARKMLGFTLAHTGTLAGVVGMPGFAAASFIINKLADMFGDDDEPYNLENELRKALGDGDFARIVMRGVPMAAGVDISGKVGMGTALSILPYSDMDMTRAGFNEMATGLTLGATGGLGARVWEALGNIKDGDYYRGVAGLMPKGVADAYRAFHEATNGMLRKNGDTLIGKDEIGAFDSFAKAIGLTTAKESERKFDQDVIYNNKQAFEDRATQLKAQYVKARRDGDTEAAQKAMQSWQKLQTSRRAAGMTVQPVSTLLKAPIQQMKRDRNVSGGVQYDKNTRRMVLAQTEN